MVAYFGKIFVEISRKSLKKLLQYKEICDIMTILFFKDAKRHEEKEKQICL